MKTFRDNNGKEWNVTINVATIKRVRDLTKVNLLEIVEGSLIEKLFRDPILLCDVIYVICKPDADRQNVSDEAFGRAMSGDAIEQATVALLEELVNFFPSQRDRANLAKVINKSREAMEKARDLIEARLDSGEVDRAIEQALGLASGLSGAVQASAESTPDSSPCVN